MTRGVALLLMMALAGGLRLRRTRQDASSPSLPPPKSTGPLADRRPALPGRDAAPAAKSTTTAARRATARATRATWPPGMKRFEFRTGRGFDPHDRDHRRQGHADEGHLAGRRRAAATSSSTPGRHAVRRAHRGQGRGAGDPSAPARQRVRARARTTGTRPSRSPAAAALGPCLKDDMKQWFDQRAPRRPRHLRQVRLDARRGHPLVGRALARADARGPDARLRPARLQVRAALRPRHADLQGHLGRQGRRGGEHAGRRARAE